MAHDMAHDAQLRALEDGLRAQDPRFSEAMDAGQPCTPREYRRGRAWLLQGRSRVVPGAIKIRPFWVATIAPFCPFSAHHAGRLSALRAIFARGTEVILDLNCGITQYTRSSFLD